MLTRLLLLILLDTPQAFNLTRQTNCTVHMQSEGTSLLCFISPGWFGGCCTYVWSVTHRSHGFPAFTEEKSALCYCLQYHLILGKVG